METLPAPIMAYGFPQWKHPVVRQCFAPKPVAFIPRGAVLPTQGTLILWGMEARPPELCEAVRIVRLEDGFLRSVGLGADLVRPLSWVVDSKSMYYHAMEPSDLETLLANHLFPAKLLERAGALRAKIVAAKLTKYNTGTHNWSRPDTTRPIMLVVGQVESDASITYGSPNFKTNMALLQAVRQECPDAYIIYKPHPDVVARLRLEGKDEKEAIQWCDQVVTDISIDMLFEAVGHVHVLTSLAGFEALLRGKKVTCWGQPFYAGWGLTEDKTPIARRTRSLSLDMVVAGALIEYPLYLSRDGTRRITPEEAVETLIVWRKRTPLPQWVLSIYRMFLRFFAGVR